MVSRCGGGGAQEFLHFYASRFLASAQLTTTGVVLDIQTGGHMTGSLNANGVYFQVDGSHRLQVLNEPGVYYTASLTIPWPAFAGDRYIELTSTNPTADFMQAAVPIRTRVGTTPEGDYQTVAGVLIPTGGGGFATLVANVFQASGAGQTISACNLSVIAHLLEPTT